MTDLERLGGEEVLVKVVTTFVHRMADDFIIGFIFQGKDLARIVRHEIELARVHLGGPGVYSGRPIGAVHRPLPINSGHFRRRLALLRTVLRQYDVEEEVIDRWVAHNQRLEPVVTDGTDCVPESPSR